MKRIICLLALLLLLAGCAGRNQETEGTSVPTDSTSTESTAAFACDAAFFGDSITCDGNFDELLPEYRVVNLGVYGDTLEQLLARVSQLRAENPARIFLLGGINSLNPDNVERCVSSYEALLEAIQTACPRARLCVQSVLPVGRELDPEGAENEAVRAFNRAIQALAEEKGCGWVDLYSLYEKEGFLDPAQTRDGLHLNFNAYGPWAEALAPELAEKGT